MNSPNLQQRIYLAKALNENTDTLFDHPQMNEEEMGEESITEGAKRKARLLRAMTSGKNFGDLEIAKKRATAYDSELGRRVARKLRKGGAPKRTIAKFFNKDTKTSPAVDKAIARFNEKELAIQQKLRAMGKNISEGMDLNEGSYVHSKGQLKKAIKGSKRNIVKAMRKGDKKEASFWMQNKKDAEEQLKEGSLGQKRVKRVFKSKRDDMKFQDSTIAKTRNLVTRKVLRAGADPRDVATRMKDSSANLRTLNALQRFNDLARIKKSQGLMRTISAKRAKSAQK